MQNPISGPLNILFGLSLEFGSYFKKMRANGATIRSQVMKYIRQRKSGTIKSKMQGYDLMSVFLEDQEQFSDEKIAENLIFFIFAAIETSHFTFQNILAYLTQSKQSLAKVRQEFLDQVLKPALDQDAGIKHLDRKAQLDKVTTLEAAQDLEFVTMVLKEAIRYRTPAPTSQIYYLKRHLTAGDYNLQENDIILINSEALHSDPDQWQRPTEFLPQRFDNNDPLSLTPSGQKRHVNAWNGFHGGSRVCFGKTLAEAQIKILTTYMTQNFNFAFENEQFNVELPFTQIDMANKKPIWIKLTANSQ